MVRDHAVLSRTEREAGLRLLAVAVDRDSSDAVILNAFRRLVRKVGGRMMDLEVPSPPPGECPGQVR